MPYRDPERRRAKDRQCYERKGRNRVLVKLYGITAEQYDDLLAEQWELCALCSEPRQKGFRLAVDHDHATGKVRGLLCHRCNVALGRAETVPGWTERAAKYLAHFQESQAAQEAQEIHHAC